MKLGVLASGQGTNLQAIIDRVQEGRVAASVAVVVSDRKEAFALERAERHGIEVLYVSPKPFSSREEYDRHLADLLQERGVSLVVLAGFMRLLSPVLIHCFPYRILNIHPSLLPAFPGLEGVKQALDYGVKVTGCTVHFVDEGLDTGPILLQDVVPVHDDDTVESLHQRIHVLEHRLYPRAIDLVSRGRVTLRGRRCYVDDDEQASTN